MFGCGPFGMSGHDNPFSYAWFIKNILKQLASQAVVWYELTQYSSLERASVDYRTSNKAAWEEVFEHRKPGWGDDIPARLKQSKLACFDSDLKATLESMNFEGKTVAHFFCNNGRELLSLMGLGVSSGVGFDFAENILEQARSTAEKAGIKNCSFVLCDVLEIPPRYYGQFDVVLFTIGGIIWIEDLVLLFEQVGKCLKDTGLVLINDGHPFLWMLPLPEEDDFDENHLNRVTNSYFRKEPWVENNGMEYLAGAYDSKTFTSFVHTLGDVINALSANGMKTVRLSEYDHDIGMGGEVYDGSGFPLSYILIAEKG